ncbi:putative membrane protein [Proteiniphilum saccharofermentans]|uniref:Putative membrane protein n=2 Tax=Proteiniphilum saccharofermentans TaxID=1642647 RepID=A0A1R3T253_9BACT|nr:putative membrane protein [Proteiniphilum saccharofermentans]
MAIILFIFPPSYEIILARRDKYCKFEYGFPIWKWIVNRLINKSVNHKMSYIKKRIQSFAYAFRGLYFLFKEAPNALIHLIAAIIAISSGFIYKISYNEWLAIIIVIGAVFSMEAINTALERLSDYTCNKEIHPAIKKVKDLSAAAVLIVAVAALAVGITIFLPKIF